MGMFQRGRLSRRVESLPARLLRMAVLEADRHAPHRSIAWQFTRLHAREKLAQLSPLARTHLTEHS